MFGMLFLIAAPLLSAVPVLGARQRFKVKDRFGCPATEAACKCTVKNPVMELPLLKGSRTFVAPMQPSFYIAQAGLEKYEARLQDFPDVTIQCEQFFDPAGLDGVPCAVCESTDGPVQHNHPARCFDGPVERVAGAIPGMCLEPEAEFLRCKPSPAVIERALQYYGRTGFSSIEIPRAYFPAKESVARHARRVPKEMICERYDDRLADNTKRVFCEWKPKDADGILQKNFSGVDAKDPELIRAKSLLKQTCADTVPNLGSGNAQKMSLIGRMTGNRFPTCGYDMKLNKCLTRLESDLIEVGPWASSYGNKVAEYTKWFG